MRGPSATDAQSGVTPLTHSFPKAASIVSSSPNCAPASGNDPNTRPARSRAVCSARVDSVRPGPTSNRIDRPELASVLIPAAKRTGSRACRAQYAGDVASSGRIQSPVTVETYGVVGSRRVTPAISSVNGPIIGSIMGEWNACDVCSQR